MMVMTALEILHVLIDKFVVYFDLVLIELVLRGQVNLEVRSDSELVIEFKCFVKIQFLELMNINSDVNVFFIRRDRNLG